MGGFREVFFLSIVTSVKDNKAVTQVFRFYCAKILAMVDVWVSQIDQEKGNVTLFILVYVHFNFISVYYMLLKYTFKSPFKTAPTPYLSWSLWTSSICACVYPCVSLGTSCDPCLSFMFFPLPGQGGCVVIKVSRYSHSQWRQSGWY